VLEKIAKAGSEVRMSGRYRATGRAATGRGSTGRSATAGSPARPEPGRADLAAQRARLRAVIDPVVTAAGFDLEDLSVSRAGRRRLLRVTVDGDGGVSLDAVADLSRDISAALDRSEETEGELTADEYVLEVSSPGVDRPLTLPRHWRRGIGRLVAVTAGGRRLVGRVSAADEERVTLDVEGRELDFRHEELGPGRVQVEFARLDEIGDELDEDLSDTGHEDEGED
jgi:ribosome maturation factor RimP